MRSRSMKHAPEVVFRNGHPSAVILDIKYYQDMLERLEDAEDLKMLQEIRKKPFKLVKFDDFLKEHGLSV